MIRVYSSAYLPYSCTGVMELHIFAPTTKENAAARLFFRFFLCYLIGTLLTAPFFARHGSLPSLDGMGGVQCVFLLLAGVAAFLTVSGPFLLLLTLCKATLDATLLCRVFALSGGGSRAILTCNTVLCYLVCTLLLFCFVAALSGVFSYHTKQRDARLLFSPSCAILLLKFAACAVSALLLYRVWPRVAALFCSI